jgi:phosphomannomutase
MKELTCFKAYDIRGRLPDELNEDVVYRVGRAYAEFLRPKQVVIGHDIRLSSAELTDALANGLMDAGVDVIHIGECGTEEIYFATFHLGVDGGICVTASHNPKDYNGMKLVKAGSRPISGDTGLNDIKKMAEANNFAPVDKRGTLTRLDNRAPYIEHLLTYVERDQLKPLKVVVNAGNGGAGLVIDAIESFLPFEFITSQMATSPTACPTRCWKKTARPRRQRLQSTVLI